MSLGVWLLGTLIASAGLAQSTLFGPQRVITTLVDFPWSVYASDLDGDGDQDVLSASAFDDKIAWYENTDGMGTFGAQQTINVSDPDDSAENGNEGDADGPTSVIASDLDGDGDNDVLFTSHFDGKIAWYENTDGMGAFGPQQVITNSAFGATSVFTADLDGDGDLDVLSAIGPGNVVDDKIAWYENIDGLGAFGPQRVITTLVLIPTSVFAADLDGDGDEDVLSASAIDDKIAWYENTDGMGAFGPQRLIATSGPRPIRRESVFAADLDGDGDLDVLSASSGDDKIAWYENMDGRGAFGPELVINTPDPDVDPVHPERGDQGDADHAESVFAADLDGDGDLDVLSASQGDSKIAWYENTDGMGAFGPQQVITTSASGAREVFAADLDGDGDLDVLSASSGDDKIAWYENVGYPNSIDSRWAKYP